MIYTHKHTMIHLHTMTHKLTRWQTKTQTQIHTITLTHDDKKCNNLSMFSITFQNTKINEFSTDHANIYISHYTYSTNIYDIRFFSVRRGMWRHETQYVPFNILIRYYSVQVWISREILILLQKSKDLRSQSKKTTIFNRYFFFTTQINWQCL